MLSNCIIASSGGPAGCDDDDDDVVVGVNVGNGSLISGSPKCPNNQLEAASAEALSTARTYA